METQCLNKSQRRKFSCYNIQNEVLILATKYMKNMCQPFLPFSSFSSLIYICLFWSSEASSLVTFGERKTSYCRAMKLISTSQIEQSSYFKSTPSGSPLGFPCLRHQSAQKWERPWFVHIQTRVSGAASPASQAQSPSPLPLSLEKALISPLNSCWLIDYTLG